MAEKEPLAVSSGRVLSYQVDDDDDEQEMEGRMKSLVAVLLTLAPLGLVRKDNCGSHLWYSMIQLKL